MKKSILDPIVNPYELNKASEEQADHRQKHQLADENEKEEEENNKSESEAAKFETSASLDNELKEFVKQRYQKRYRSKFRKSSHLVDDIIIEENEEDLRLEAENNEDMFKKHLKAKPKKEVTFSEPKTIIHHVQADQEQSSEDELNGYAKVVVSQNLAEEILDEIYGKIDTLRTYENSSVGENGAIEAPLENSNKSLADEILDELYGHNDNEKPKDQNQNEENSMYEEISKPDLEQPVIQGRFLYHLWCNLFFKEKKNVSTPLYLKMWHDS